MTSTIADCEFDAGTAARLAEYSARWRRAPFETRPADRPAAEAGVRQAYRLAGLAEPATIIWCASPVGIEQSRKAVWHDLHPGKSVTPAVVNLPLEGALRAIVGLPGRPYSAVTHAFDFRAATTQFKVVSTAVGDSVNRVRWKFGSFFRFLTRNWGELGAFSDFEDSRWSPWDARNVLGICQFAHDVLDYRRPTARLEGLWQIALNAGWMLPHERVCWLSERWQVCSVDAQGRLHNDKGPAIAFADGWHCHLWKGVQVPAWVIQAPQRITASLIDAEPNPFVRRCMIEIMTPARYVASGAPRLIAQDRFGKLWLKSWSRTDIWAAVEVINGTAEPDGSFARYFLQVPGHLRTPLEAAAWTYGMSPERYATLGLRT